MELPLDGQFYTLLLKHLSAYYYSTISGLEESVIEALFLAACEILEQYRPKDRCKLPYMLRVTEKAMLTKNIELWKLASSYQ